MADLWDPSQAEASAQSMAHQFAAEAPAIRARLRDLHAKQRAFVSHPAKRKLVRGGRRGGKTVGVATLSVERFLEGRRILYAVPTADQLERYWFEVKYACEPAIDSGALYKNESRHILEVPGTLIRIRAKTAWNADTLRGDYADLLLLDEYQLMDESAWHVVGQPMLLDNNGDAVLIYTPPSARQGSGNRAHDPRHAAKLYKEAEKDTTGRWATFTFTSHDNPYLSSIALEEIARDMTTVTYRQEILAQDVEEVPGALWSQAVIDATRVREVDVPDLVRIAVALDPAATSEANADEMGIVAMGRDARRPLEHGYVLADASMRGTPAACARAALVLYDRLGADVMVGEGNNGGEWIGTVIRMVAEAMFREGDRPTKEVNYRMVHASHGKQTRAEPISSLYEHRRMHHVGTFPALEDQQTAWVPGLRSPDRMDALVWAGTELLLEQTVKRAGTWG